MRGGGWATLRLRSGQAEAICTPLVAYPVQIASSQSLLAMTWESGVQLVLYPVYQHPTYLIFYILGLGKMIQGNTDQYFAAISGG